MTNTINNPLNLTLAGLRNAAAETRCIRRNSGHAVQIAYDRSTGEVMTTYHVSANSYSVYRDPSVITVCHAERRMTQQEIADAITFAVQHA